MQFVRINDPDKRAYLAATVQQVSDGFVVEQGDNVVLDSSALNTLRYLPADADGHYDGQHIWIGGTEYDVAKIDPQPEPEVLSEPVSTGLEIRWWTPQIPGPSLWRRIPEPVWPDDWPIPQIGQSIHVTRPETGESWDAQPRSPDDPPPVPSCSACLRSRSCSISSWFFCDSALLILDPLPVGNRGEDFIVHPKPRPGNGSGHGHTTPYTLRKIAIRRPRTIRTHTRSYDA